MSSIATLYSNEVKKQFKVIFANCELGGPIELGDYDVMDGNIFIPQGKLKNDFPEFNENVIHIMADPFKDQKQFVSGRLCRE